ncbi:MAG: hypothetical protein FJZ47_11000 [Candidatus Tectomicrobia bacterium]|uniref:Uncharacterized protein n=1 Tax=Tectimicrobiota bacterium TaxID=2528274 RepID=A0A937W169_UNCTE|nr:hypothetical protein [Candidatus Tectomicrobia bacterium]
MFNKTQNFLFCDGHCAALL